MQPTAPKSPFLEFLHLAADFSDASDDLMTGHTRIVSSTPFIARDVQIGMTYTTKLNVDLHVVWQRIAALRNGFSGSVAE